MCLPVIGGIVSGVGAAMGAAGEAAGARANAALQRRQAQIEKQTGAYKADRKNDEVTRVVGQQRAGFAGNGIALSGSAADTIADSTEEGALDVAAIRWNSRLAADNLSYQAKVSDMNAGIASSAIAPAFLAPTINGIAQYTSSFA